MGSAQKTNSGHIFGFFTFAIYEFVNRVLRTRLKYQWLRQKVKSSVHAQRNEEITIIKHCSFFKPIMGKGSFKINDRVIFSGGSGDS